MHRRSTGSRRPVAVAAPKRPGSAARWSASRTAAARRAAHDRGRPQVGAEAEEGGEGGGNRGARALARLPGELLFGVDRGHEADDPRPCGAGAGLACRRTRRAVAAARDRCRCARPRAQGNRPHKRTRSSTGAATPIRASMRLRRASLSRGAIWHGGDQAASRTPRGTGPHPKTRDIPGARRMPRRGVCGSWPSTSSLHRPCPTRPSGACRRAGTRSWSRERRSWSSRSCCWRPPWPTSPSALHRLSHGDARWLALALVLEALSFLGPGRPFPRRRVDERGRIDLRRAVEITLAGHAATRLLASAGAGGVALTAWAMRRRHGPQDGRRAHDHVPRAPLQRVHGRADRRRRRPRARHPARRRLAGRDRRARPVRRRGDRRRPGRTAHPPGGGPRPPRARPRADALCGQRDGDHRGTNRRARRSRPASRRRAGCPARGRRRRRSARPCTRCRGARGTW